MKRKILKRASALILALVMAASVAGCASNTGSSSTGSAASGTSSKAAGPKTKILFWHQWSGDEGKQINATVDAYNKQSDKYEVQALSVPDAQKIMTATSAGNGPDVSDDYTGDIGKYASTGVLLSLDDYISKTSYDTSDYIPVTLESCKMGGKTYALPLNINFSGLYYNKTLLKEAGYSEPPKTVEEMYEMAVKTTKVNKDGSLAVCGFPDFPSCYYMSTFGPAAGGGWYTKDDKASAADDAGNAFALKLSRDYRTKFGLANVVKFESSGKYLDPTDPFFAGKQTFRIDGPWIAKEIKEVTKSNVDYGVTDIPYPKDKPELKSRQTVSCDMIYISANSKNKDAAWDFISWFAGKDGEAKAIVAIGNLPSRTSVWSDATFKKSYDVDFYTGLSKSTNLVAIPNGPQNGEYNTLCNDQVELCLNLKQDVNTTLKNIHDKGSSILG